MRDKHDHSMDAKGLPPVADPVSALVADRLARRRVLLKGLGKGSALVAAATPIKTLAFTSSVTPGGLLCSISGTQSGVHSQGTHLPTCGGLSPGYYKTPEHWPGYNAGTGIATNTVGLVTFTQNTPCNTVFGGTGAHAAPSNTLIDIMINHPSTDEFHWIAALLNAIVGTIGTSVFPYSRSEVIAFYNEPSLAKYNAALQFFKDWMEKL
jgi:hypothetical protein